ncbi:MAG TPA: hypothetical protein VGW38_25755, partial [Chloroflexota bacterium]|nr:hypothetical protein [Chloroflexota bacterium]
MRSPGGLLFLFLLSLYLITGGGRGYSIDGSFGYEMAKTAFLDPEHTYFKRFRTAFARWGALMPLLGQPFVLAGDALSRVAPERDALVVDGHTYRVEEWPALGPGGRGAYAPARPPQERVYSRLGLISSLSNSTKTPQDAVVGWVRVWEEERLVEIPIQAGIHTAEWALDRPDIAGTVAHRRARVAGHWIGQPRGNLYIGYVQLPVPMAVTRWELGGERDGATWHVRAAAFQEAGSGAWSDVYTGERFWSARQTRDFFTRLIYSTLNAFTTAGTGVLVYAIAGLLGYALVVRLVVALGFGVATMAWPYAKLDFSEPASTFFVMLAVWALYTSLRGRRRRESSSIGLGLVASLALLLAIVGKYTAVLSAGATLVQWAVSSRWWHPEGRKRAVSFAVALVFPALVLGLAGVAVVWRFTGETPILFRNVFDRAGEDWLALPVWIGLRGLLFSPGKSLFLYSPWLLLAIPGMVLFARRHGRDAVLFTLFPVVVIWLYSMKVVWHGGGWGPRYLVPLLPLLAVTTAPVVEWCLRRGRLAKIGLTGLAAVSIAVQGLGVAKDPEAYASMVREFVVPSLPDAGSHYGGRDYWLARGGDGLTRALAHPTSGGRRRGLGYLWGYPEATLEISFKEPRKIDLSLYFLDWDRQARRQTVVVEDAGGRRVWELDRDFSHGLWATWQVSGAPGLPVRVHLTQRGPDTAVLSAAAFDSPRTRRQATPLLDEQSRGDWVGRYGEEGYALFAWHSFNVDLSQIPPYVLGMEASHIGDAPDPRIHVEIAEQEVLDTPLLYAAPFSPLLGNAWLLGVDALRLALPGRPDLVQGALARPPWTWFGIQAPRLEH